jgi:TRAP-type C4-dicarboxylate transport system substrate-binding protein
MENQEAKELSEQKEKLKKDKKILEAKENEYINKQRSNMRKNNNRLRMLIGKALMKYIDEDDEKFSRKKVLASILNRYTAYEPDRTFLIEQGYLDL